MWSAVAPLVGDQRVASSRLATGGVTVLYPLDTLSAALHGSTQGDSSHD